MSDKATGQKTRSPEGFDENGAAAELLLSHGLGALVTRVCSTLLRIKRLYAISDYRLANYLS
ncbi:MAG: hypothetical protein WAK31_28365 [Chthoniobacterales bacterium]